MNARVEVKSSGTMDVAQLVLAVLLLIAGIAAYYWFSAESVLLRGGLLAAGIVGSLALFVFTATGRRARSFLTESQFELRKIVWPTRQVTLQTTVVVVIVVFVISIVLWLFDMALGWAILDQLLKSKD